MFRWFGKKQKKNKFECFIYKALGGMAPEVLSNNSLKTLINYVAMNDLI